METVSTESHGAVQLITLNRPEALNAFNTQQFDDLCDAVLDATADEKIKVLLLTGAGRAFSAGADLMEMGSAPRQPKHGLTGLLHSIIDCAKPIVLAVNGLGVGIGATICGLADFVYIAQSARLRCPFSSLGLTAEAGSTLTFPLIMGRQRASWFLLASEWLSANEVVSAGLALEVTADDEILDRALSQANVLAALPAASLQATKTLITGPWREQLKASVAAENAALAQLVGKPANREALAAFKAKRDPDFTNL